VILQVKWIEIAPMFSGFDALLSLSARGLSGSGQRRETVVQCLTQHRIASLRRRNPLVAALFA
jgi:hypothetical protein